MAEELTITAETEQVEAKPVESVKAPEPKESKPEAKYTDEDVNRIVQERLARAQKKSDEAKRLASMTAEEKAQAEIEELKKQISALTKADTESKMSASARARLSEKGITVSDELVTMLVTDNADSTAANVDKFAELFNAAVQDALKKQFKGTTPKTGGAAGKLTKEDIMKVQNRAERQRLINDNLELFK